MSNEESMAAAAVASRRVPRQGVGGSPVGSTLSIVLAVVAVVAGFLILRNITDDGGSSAGGVDLPVTDEGAVTTLPEDEAAATTTPTTEPPPTTIAKVTAGATVAVANANTVGGSAGAMTKSLELEGYTMGEAVNATGPNIDDTVVYYDPAVAAALDVANSVARDLGGVSVLTVTSPAPTESGDLGDAAVLVLLGNNEAGKTVAELVAAAEATGVDATATDTAEAPAVAGSDDATTTDDATTDDATTDDATTDDESTGDASTDE